MSYASSIMSLLLISCLLHTFIKREKEFPYKWNVFKNYFLLGAGTYFVSWDIECQLTLALCALIILSVLRALLKLSSRASFGLNLLGLIFIITAVNSINYGQVTAKTYVSLTYLFGSFFTIVFDSILLFRRQMKFKVIYLICGYLFIFNCLWAIFEMNL